MDKEVLKFAFTIGLFVVAMLPLLIDNLRNGTATNRNNLILALAGIATLAVGHQLNWNQQSLWEAGAWIATGIIVLMLVSIMGFMPGGVSKMMMALLPWFTMTNYLLVIAIGSILVVADALVIKRDIPVALPLAIASTCVWISDFFVHL